jgi:hypothetical protein
VEGTPETEPAVTEPGGNANGEATIGGADEPDNVDVQKKANGKMILLILAISLVVVAGCVVLYIFVIKPKISAQKTKKTTE